MWYTLCVAPEVLSSIHARRLSNIHVSRTAWALGLCLSAQCLTGRLPARWQGFEDWQCGALGEANFPCGWEGSVLTPRDPFSNVFITQPQVRQSRCFAQCTCLLVQLRCIVYRKLPTFAMQWYTPTTACRCVEAFNEAAANTWYLRRS